MNRMKLRDLIATLRGEMARGITAQRLGVLSTDAFDAIMEADEDEVRAIAGARLGHSTITRHVEALMRESAIWLLDDLEDQRGQPRVLTREQKLAVITTRMRDFARTVRSLT
jgi:hypothetical protein